MMPRWLLLTLAWMVGALFCVILGLAVGFKLWAPQVVREFQAVVANTPNNTLVYADSGEVLATLQGLEDRNWVPLAHIHPFMQKAAVAIEDRRFFAHRGLDPVRLAGALWADVRSMSLDQGGSTITQQLVKLSLLSSERTLTRKGKELFMAVALEQELPKLELLEAYLNRVYFGFGMYGVEKASQGYFHKSADALTLNEAALLAALIKKPEGYLQLSRPDPDPDSAELPLALMEPLLKRQRAVIESLRQLGWISQEDYLANQRERLALLRPRAEELGGVAPYFVQAAQKELKEILSVSRISGRGLRVYTTLDLRQQQAAEAVVARVARESKEASQAALVSLETQTGFVRALVGGVDFSRSQFNRATQALRQPGSAFKPLVYAAALESGMTPVAIFQDEPVRFVWSGVKGQFQRIKSLGDAVATERAAAASLAGASPAEDEPQFYEPRNFDGRYGLPAVRAAGSAMDAPALPPDRRMTLGRALELSSNVIAVQLLDQVGMNPVVALAGRFNMTIRPEMGLCVALGCAEVSLLNLTTAYASFANGGLRVGPVFVKRVTNSQGDVLYERGRPLPEHVLSDWTAFQMRRLLAGVMERGTGRAARLGRPSGGKTGTNDGPRDTWFIGFTPRLATGIWMGNDDNRVMPDEAGGRTTARLWAEFMRAADSGPPAGFPEPSEEYVAYKICNLDGRLNWDGCPDVEAYPFRRGDIPADVFAGLANGALPDSSAGSGQSFEGANALPAPRAAPAGPALPLDATAAGMFAQKLKDAFSPAPRSLPPE